MSCQQVPRLPEDPYTFTEPPATAKYFSSQSHKLQSLNRLQSSSHHPFDGSTAATATTTNSTTIPATNITSSSNSSSKSIRSTSQPTATATATAAAAATQSIHQPNTNTQPLQANGSTAAATSTTLPKRHGPIFSKTAARQLQQQQQQQTLSQLLPPPPKPPAHVFDALPPPPPTSPALRASAAADAVGGMAKSPSLSPSQSAADTTTNSSTVHHNRKLQLAATTTTTNTTSSRRVGGGGGGIKASHHHIRQAPATIITSQTPSSVNATIPCFTELPVAGSTAGGGTAVDSKIATSPLAAQLPPTPPSSSPVYSPRYATTTATPLLQHSSSHSTSISSSPPIGARDSSPQFHLASSVAMCPTLSAVQQPPPKPVVAMNAVPAAAVRFVRPMVGGAAATAVAKNMQHPHPQPMSGTTTPNTKRPSPATHSKTKQLAANIAAVAFATATVPPAAGSNPSATTSATLLPVASTQFAAPPTLAATAAAPAPSNKNRLKRSYSNSLHHEALQRIAPPSSSSSSSGALSTTAITTVVAPPLPPPPPSQATTNWASPVVVATPVPTNIVKRRISPSPPAAAAVVVAFIQPAASGHGQRRPNGVRPEWHAPGDVLFDLPDDSATRCTEASTVAVSGNVATCLLPAPANASPLRVCTSPPPPPLHVQHCWFHPPKMQATIAAATPRTDQIANAAPSHVTGDPPAAASSSATREQRLQARLRQLHSRAAQMRLAQTVRTMTASSGRVSAVQQTLHAKQRLLAAEAAANAASRCQVPECGRRSLLLARYCQAHITRDERQRLFSACTAKFADNTQCALPAVFCDASHEMPLCREHAWKRDNYSRIVQEQKNPKKSASRKKPPPKLACASSVASNHTSVVTATAATSRPTSHKRQPKTVFSGASNTVKRKSPKSATKTSGTSVAPRLLSKSASLSFSADSQSLPDSVPTPSSATPFALSAAAIDTSSNSSFTHQSMLIGGGGHSPPSILNHFTISSNDSFGDSNDATNFASILGDSCAGGTATSLGGFGGSGEGTGLSYSSSCISDGIGGGGFGGIGLGGGDYVVDAGGGGSGASTQLLSGSTTPSTSVMSAGESPMQQPQMNTLQQLHQQQYFQAQQFDEMHQPFQQPQNMFSYGQQYQQQQQQMPFISRYPSANQFFSQHTQSSGIADAGNLAESLVAAIGEAALVGGDQQLQQQMQQLHQLQQQHPLLLGSGGGGGSLKGSTRLSDMFTASENSSAYESSEDTGIGGGLSESEQQLGGNGGGGGVHDVMHVDDAEDDLNNVISQLQFEDILSAKPAHEEDELLDRALDFFDDILDVDDEILESVDQLGGVGGGGGGGLGGIAAEVVADFEDDDRTVAIHMSRSAAAKVGQTMPSTSAGKSGAAGAGGRSGAGKNCKDIRGMVHT